MDDISITFLERWFVQQAGGELQQIVGVDGLAQQVTIFDPACARDDRGGSVSADKDRRDIVLQRRANRPWMPVSVRLRW